MADQLLICFMGTADSFSVLRGQYLFFFLLTSERLEKHAAILCGFPSLQGEKPTRYRNHLIKIRGSLL